MVAKRETRFLLIEDSPFLAARLEEMLRAGLGGVPDITVARTIEGAIAELSGGLYDVCFLDHHFGTADGRDVLKQVDVQRLLTAIIFFTDHASREIAYEALRLGVDDLLLKNKFDRFELEKSVAYAMYRKFRQVELQKATLKDALTGVGNRVLFQEQLKTAIARARRDNERVGVMYLDIDGFKPVNDTFGHDVGDKLLQAVAERMVERTRSSDVVARIGGDEFAAVLFKVDDRAALDMVARNVEAAIGASYDVEGKTIRIGASVGTSLFPDDGDDMSMLIRLADKNMYTAKLNRRGALGKRGNDENIWH